MRVGTRTSSASPQGEAFVRPWCAAEQSVWEIQANRLTPVASIIRSAPVIAGGRRGVIIFYALVVS